ncbi:MAG: RraA family protein [Dongiaceae bacterium]
MNKAHSAGQGSDVLGRLRAYRTPTVYDSIERFNLRPKSEGYTDHTVRCMLPSLGVFVGYAWTGKIVGELPEAPGEAVLSWRAVWESVAIAPRPSIAVVQDLDQAPGRGCAWGDVSATIFKALGCVAAITNGSVRDLPEMGAIGFGLFAGGPTVGHANVRFVEMGTPVKVGGLVVRPGDLVHADEHGALIIPAEIDLEELLRITAGVLAAEEKVKRFCLSPNFDVAELDDLHSWSMETSG